MEPSFFNSKRNFKVYLQKLISTEIRDFQRDYEVKIVSVNVQLIDVLTETGLSISILDQIKVNIERI